MSGATLLFEHTLTPETERFPMSHAPFLIDLGEGRVMATWFAGSREWGHDVQLLAAVYDSKSETWEPIFPLVSEPDYSVGNSVWAREGDTLHLWYVRTRRYWQDGEVVHRVFGDPLVLGGPPDLLALPKGWLVRGRPILDGSLLRLPVYCDRSACSAVWQEELGTEGGKLSEVLSAPGGLIQPVLVEVGGDELRAFFRNQREPCRVHCAYSMDRGRTWSRIFPTSLPNPNSSIDVVCLREETLICAYNDSDRERNPLSLAISRDRGMTWRKVADVERGPREMSYPSLVFTGDALHLAYSWQRRAIRFVTLDWEGLSSAG